jgi:molybdopterin/thiamine biosynthesis adenylyltransferase
MTTRTEYFTRVENRVNVGQLSQAFVAIVGVGAVGSTLALELARCGVGRLLLADGDQLEPVNLARHALPGCYVGTNKAQATAAHLALNVPDIDVGAVAHHLDQDFEDQEIDLLLAPADLVVVATDQRAAQRRVARRALAMDIPAIVPGLYADRGGEVFVQLNPGQPCFLCWDGFRDEGSEVRAVTSVNADAFAVIQQAVYLCLAFLEPGSRHARDLAPSHEDPRPRQLFVLRPGAAMLRSPAVRRPGCPSCEVGLSPIHEQEHEATSAVAAATRFATRERRQAAGWEFVLTGELNPPTILSVAVSDPLVAQGGTSTVSWRTRNATHVVLGDHGVHPPVGELTVAVRDSTVFTVSAANPFGVTTAISPVVRAVPIPRIREVSLLGFPTLLTPYLPSAPAPSLLADERRRQAPPRRERRAPAMPSVLPLAPPLPFAFTTPRSRLPPRRSRGSNG